MQNVLRISYMMLRSLKHYKPFKIVLILSRLLIFLRDYKTRTTCSDSTCLLCKAPVMLIEFFYLRDAQEIQLPYSQIMLLRARLLNSYVHNHSSLHPLKINIFNEIYIINEVQNALSVTYMQLRSPSSKFTCLDDWILLNKFI